MAMSCCRHFQSRSCCLDLHHPTSHSRPKILDFLHGTRHRLIDSSHCWGHHAHWPQNCPGVHHDCFRDRHRHCPILLRLRCWLSNRARSLHLVCSTLQKFFHRASLGTAAASFLASHRNCVGCSSRRHRKSHMHPVCYGNVGHSHSRPLGRDHRCRLQHWAQSFQIPCRQWHRSGPLPCGGSCFPC